MPEAVDFRTTTFEVTKVDESGVYIGSEIYWKLYAIENLLRVIVNSVLSESNFSPNWWPKFAGRILLSNGDTLDILVNQRRRQYKKPHVETSPGKHNIYYLTLPELRLIIDENYLVFRDLIDDIDGLQKRIKRVRLPRNIVSHMNWLEGSDKNEIDSLYQDLVQLVPTIEGKKVKIIAPI